MKKFFFLSIPLLFLSGCTLPTKDIANVVPGEIQQKLNSTLQQIEEIKNQNISLEQTVQQQLQKIQTLLTENQQLKQEIEKYKAMIQQNMVQ